MQRPLVEKGDGSARRETIRAARDREGGHVNAWEANGERSQDKLAALLSTGQLACLADAFQSFTIWSNAWLLTR